MHRALVLLCVVLWSYPLGVDNAVGQAVQTMMEVRVCGGDGVLARSRSQQFLEVWRTMRFVDGGFISEVMELRLPRGSDEEPKR